MNSSAIHTAAKKGDLYALRQELMNKHVDVNARDGSGYTPLMIASESGQFEAVKGLIANGATVDLARTTGMTALQLACQSGHTAVAKFLLDQGASINKADICGETPLHHASGTNLRRCCEAAD